MIKQNLIKINTAYCDKFLRNKPRNLIWNNIDHILHKVVRRAIATRFNLAQRSHQVTYTKKKKKKLIIAVSSKDCPCLPI